MLNSITVTGNLGADPEMRYLPSGQCVTSFPLYDHYKWGHDKEDLCIFKITFFGKRGENANQFLHKGDSCMVTGRFHATTFTGRDGQDKTILEIMGSDFRALGNRKTQFSEVHVPEGYGDVDSPVDFGDDVDDLPF